MLTKEELLKKPEGTILGAGITSNPILHSGPVKWVAVVGGGEDWALYYHRPDYAYEEIMQIGDKACTESVIRALIPCDDEVWGRYRK